jgi:hypothetical protein
MTGDRVMALSHPVFGRPLVKSIAYGSSIPEIEVADIEAFEVVRLKPSEESAIAELAKRPQKHGRRQMFWSGRPLQTQKSSSPGSSQVPRRMSNRMKMEIVATREQAGENGRSIGVGEPDP